MTFTAPITERGLVSAMEIVVSEIRRALERDDTELAMAFLPVVEWAVEVLGREAHNQDTNPHNNQ